MTLAFECSDEPTLDGSFPIVVRSTDGKNHEEYVFQFACNIEELQDLKRETEKGIKAHRKLKALHQI